MGINWNLVIGVLFGATFVVAVFFATMWVRKRQKVALMERPPVKNKLLRPSGYSLSCRIERLSEEFYSSLVQAILAGMLLGFIWGAIYPLIEGVVMQRFTLSQIQQTPKFYLIYSVLLLTISTVCWMSVFIIKAFKSLKQIRNCCFGLRGEQAVAEELTTNRNLVSAGCISFHDVPGDGPWNIDHVVIGPAGVFVLETKTRSRRKAKGDQEEQTVLFDGKMLHFPWCFDSKAVKQVKNNADWVKNFVAGFGPKDIIVQPVVVVPGWYVEAQGNYPIKAMPATYLVKDYIIPAKRIYSMEQLDPIIRRFDERCRDLEF